MSVDLRHFRSFLVVAEEGHRVIRVPLVPPRTLPLEFIQRAGINRAAVRAFAPFAAEHLAASCAERISAP